METAAIWGLPGRGVLDEGYAADVVVFDAATIDRGPEVASDDFPGEGRRWIRRSVGMRSVVVNGTAMPNELVNIARPMEARAPRSGGYGDARRSNY